MVSNVALHGELASVPSDDQEAPPAGEAANTTCVAPVPVTVALRVTEPEIVAPGLVRTTVGALTSTVIVRIAPVEVLPAPSVMTGCRS